MIKAQIALLRLVFATLCLALAWSHPASAELQQGKQYSLVSPAQPTETGKNIEVLEFFSYACPHCFELEPVLNPWAKRLPRDVTFRRLPAVFNDTYLTYAKIFYAVEAMGAMDKLHDVIFSAVHVQHVNMANESALLAWMGQQGVDSKKFSEIYNSFSVTSKAQRAKQLSRAYGITGVPTVVVEGTYLTSASQAGSHELLLPVLDELIKKVRQSRGGRS